MKRFTLLAALGLCSISLFAQDAQKEEPKEEGFVFTTVKELPITSVKNQSRAGTCWCYSSMAFLESELLRMGKGEYDFSEMYIVHQTYLDRADAAVARRVRGGQEDRPAVAVLHGQAARDHLRVHDPGCGVAG